MDLINLGEAVENPFRRNGAGAADPLYFIAQPNKGLRNEFISGYAVRQAMEAIIEIDESLGVATADFGAKPLKSTA